MFHFCSHQNMRYPECFGLQFIRFLIFDFLSFSPPPLLPLNALAKEVRPFGPIGKAVKLWGGGSKIQSFSTTKNNLYQALQLSNCQTVKRSNFSLLFKRQTSLFQTFKLSDFQTSLLHIFQTSFLQTFKNQRLKNLSF